MIRHENYLMQFSGKQTTKAMDILQDLYYFNDGISTFLYSDNSLEIRCVHILDEIEYILHENGITKYEISLNYTIGI
jgi:hypothetical protein